MVLLENRPRLPASSEKGMTADIRMSSPGHESRTNERSVETMELNTIKDKQQMTWSWGKAPVFVLVVAVAVMAACLLLTSGPAHAATTFAVDRNDDPDPTTAKACTDTTPNDCSLRGTIVAANAGADTITVPASATHYTLSRAGSGEDAASTGDLDITDELTITGAGARTTSRAT